MERSRSFGSVAEEYDRFRPELPLLYNQWLGLRSGDHVVDVAAGTGLASRTLARSGADVVAVEPDELMAETLRRRTPGVGVKVGTAEDLPIDDQWADYVVVVSAWHWLDGERAGAEAARVLRDGGSLSIVWNGPDVDTSSLRELFELRRRFLSHESEPSSRPQGQRAVVFPLGADPFVDFTSTTLTWTWRRSPQELVGLLRTYSGVITAPVNERERLLAEARDLAAGRAEDDGLITVPMSTRCWRARRRAR